MSHGGGRAAPVDLGWRRLTTRQGDVLSLHAKLSALIRGGLDAEAADYLAAPATDEETGAVLSWEAPSGGALIPATSTDAHEAIEARIMAFAARLETQGDAGALAAHSLKSALTVPTGAASHVVEQGSSRPVLINWGMAAPGQAAPELAAAAAALATTGPEPRRRAWRPGTAIWVVPLTLAALAIWLGYQLLQPPPTVTVVVTPRAPPAADPTLGLDARLAALDGSFGEIETMRLKFQEACVAPPPPPPPEKVEPPPEPPAAPVEAAAPPEPPPEAPVPEVTVAPDRAPEPVKRVDPPEVVVLPPRETPRPAITPRPAPAAAPPTAACDPTWPPGRAPRMVFVVDGSGSMKEGISGASSRMAASKSAIGRVVRSLHKDIRIGMVSFSDCSETRNSRFYGAAERGRLLGRVNAMRPGRATSLAASIRRGGALAPRRSESVLVVVSDGEDTCGADPCAAARAVRARKPNVKINVIDLSGGRSGGVLQCIARAGGGLVFAPGSARQMTAQVQQATGQPDASGCE